MLLGIVVTALIPIVFGLMLWFTDWAESAVVAPLPAETANPIDRA
jgi:hypothetical protein